MICWRTMDLLGFWKTAVNFEKLLCSPNPDKIIIKLFDDRSSQKKKSRLQKSMEKLEYIKVIVHLQSIIVIPFK